MESAKDGWDFRSGFEKLSLTGYRNAVLEDYEEAEAAGRLRGFKCAFTSKPNLNPTFLLSRLDGIIMACLIKCESNLSEEQRTEACLIQKEIKKLLSHYYELSGGLIDKAMTGDLKSIVASTQQDSEQCPNKCCDEARCSSSDERVTVKGTDRLSDSEYSASPELQLNNVISRTRTLCDSIGWKMPELVTDFCL